MNLLQLREEVAARLQAHAPEAFAEAVIRFLVETPQDDNHVARLVAVYRVALVNYTRLKILLKRKHNNPARYRAELATQVAHQYEGNARGFGALAALRNSVLKLRSDPDFEQLSLAVDKAQEEKNRFRRELISAGLTLSDINKINRGMPWSTI